MQKREGRSFAPPPSRPQQPEPGRTGRKRWTRPDVSRPEPVTRPDVLAELPHAGHRDLASASLAGNAAVAS